MPVVKGPIKASSLTKERREAMLEKLHRELAGGSPQAGAAVSEIPLIFEIPLERLDGTSDRIDVIVVWDAFEDLRSEERSTLILDAYGDSADKVIQALGVTRPEAMEQGLLPYRVLHMERPGEANSGEIIKAMLDEGGFEIGNRVELHLPSRRMADAALARLYQRVPQGAWTIGEILYR